MVGTGCRLPNFVVQPKKHSEKQIFKTNINSPECTWMWCTYTHFPNFSQHSGRKTTYTQNDDEYSRFSGITFYKLPSRNGAIINPEAFASFWHVNNHMRLRLDILDAQKYVFVGNICVHVKFIMAEISLSTYTLSRGVTLVIYNFANI